VDRENGRELSPPYDLLSAKEMTKIPLLAYVAVSEDCPEKNLTRGQLGTVVEVLGTDDDPALLVEFADGSGQAYAFAEFRPEQLIVLHRKQSDAA
jgi:hypothetical protein